MDICPICGKAVSYRFDSRPVRASQYAFFCVGDATHVFEDIRTLRIPSHRV